MDPLNGQFPSHQPAHLDAPEEGEGEKEHNEGEGKEGQDVETRASWHLLDFIIDSRC